MNKLSREDLFSLEKYSTERPAFRTRVLEHKAHRRVGIGPHATLYFEDALTMQYQIQEMLRIEKIFEADQIQEELDAYNPLIPDGLGVEKSLWLQVGDNERVYPIANEDLERETSDKTSAVHFLRFELTPEDIEGFNNGGSVKFGIDHPQYNHVTEVPADVSSSLARDFQG
ncbi:MAG: DUF3501 family protein [Gammaproteobacteria bacterium]|nr:DUF3501 family protein [Gammaproteobacteria bacterium]